MFGSVIRSELYTAGGRIPSQRELHARAIARLVGTLALAAIHHHKQFSVEQPVSSTLFHLPEIIRLQSRSDVFPVLLDQCAYALMDRRTGLAIQAPTKILTNCLALRDLTRTCPGDHAHVPSRREQDVKKARIPQPYPSPLARRWIALWIDGFHQRALPLFQQPSWRRSTRVTIPHNKRKRELGSTPVYVEHRQFRTARAAAATGQQLRKGALPPILSKEVEPGEAIRIVRDTKFPFDDL